MFVSYIVLFFSQLILETKVDNKVLNGHELNEKELNGQCDLSSGSSR